MNVTALVVMLSGIMTYFIWSWRYGKKRKNHVPFEEARTSCVLVTGGTSGIGLELAKLFVSDCFSRVILVSNDNEHKVNEAIGVLFNVLSPLPESVQLTRNIGKLTRIIKGSESNTSATTCVTQTIQIITTDLCSSGSITSLFEDLKRENIVVTHLVNCAGFGLVGDFTELQIEKQLDMLRLNVLATTHIAYLFARDMISNNINGKLLNVSSTAGMSPQPGWIGYSSSKAYVLSLSLGLHEELRHKGISVTTLCPGPTQTSFLQSSSFVNTVASSFMKPSTPEQVAKDGYDGLLNGDHLVIVGLLFQINWIMLGVTPLKPLMMLTRFLFSLNK